MSLTQQREALPDRLRGVALLGIVVVNAAFLGISGYGFTAESVQGPGNWLTALLVFTFAQGKFYLLFSFLFGYSASFILRDNSTPHRRRYLRRLLALFLFGLAHAVFFFVGDILITYAIFGLLLLAVSRTSDRTLRRWVFAAFAVGVVFILIISTLNAAFPDESSGLEGLDSAMATGSFAEASLARLEALPLVLAIIIPLYNVLSVIVLNLSHHQHGQLPWKKIVGEIAKNPLIIAVCLALPFSLMQVQIPTLFINTGDYLASMTLPLALLGIGGTLSLKELKTTSTASIASTLLKTLILPALCTLGAYLWGLRGIHLGVLYLLFSSPTATVSFIMVRSMGGNSSLAANMILLSTFGSLLSLSGGIYLLHLYQLI